MDNASSSPKTPRRGWLGMRLVLLLLVAAPVISVAATIAWEPLSLNFGIVPVGSTEYRTLTLSHPADSTGELVISSIEYTFNDRGVFGWSAPVPAALMPGESIEVELSFTPTDLGFFMADLLVTSNATNTPTGLVYSFMGMGDDSVLPVPSISFGGFALLGGLVLAIALGGLAVQRRGRAL